MKRWRWAKRAPRTTFGAWQRSRIPTTSASALALLEVLEDEEDRKVCLKNIIAINPLNTEARRQLRLLMRAGTQSP